MEEKIKLKVADFQCGFVKSRGMKKAMFIVRNLIRKSN